MNGTLQGSDQTNRAIETGPKAAASPEDLRTREFAHLLRSLVDARASGQVEVSSALERRLLMRVEAALAAFELAWRVCGAPLGPVMRAR
ncbi:MAG: hypothetical protein ACRDV9_15105 [Acidimicrobiia bacterium]